LDVVRRAELEEKLLRVIKWVLRLHPQMHYFQVLPRVDVTNKGYHDIAEILLLVTDEDEHLACKLLHRLSLFHIRGTIPSDTSN
jgi:hypothetical protein